MFGAGGRRLAERRVNGSGLEWRIWNPPEPPAKGACRLDVTGGYDAKTEWGQVAGSLRPYPAPIDGRGFLSCIDTEYYVPGRGMRAAVLLDAHAPGRAAPAAIPGLEAIPGAGAISTSPMTTAREPLAARREGNAWIVVSGGGRGAEEARVDLLRHLRVQIDRSADTIRNAPRAQPASPTPGDRRRAGPPRSAGPPARSARRQRRGRLRCRAPWPPVALTWPRKAFRGTRSVQPPGLP